MEQNNQASGIKLKDDKNYSQSTGHIKFFLFFIWLMQPKLKVKLDATLFGQKILRIVIKNSNTTKLASKPLKKAPSKTMFFNDLISTSKIIQKTKVKWNGVNFLSVNIDNVLMSST